MFDFWKNNGIFVEKVFQGKMNGAILGLLDKANNIISNQADYAFKTTKGNPHRGKHSQWPKYCPTSSCQQQQIFQLSEHPQTQLKSKMWKQVYYKWKQFPSCSGQHEPQKAYFNMGNGKTDQQNFEGSNQLTKMQPQFKVQKNKNFSQPHSVSTSLDKRQKESMRWCHSKPIKLEILKTERLRQNEYWNENCKNLERKVDGESLNRKTNTLLLPSFSKIPQKSKHQPGISLKFHHQTQSKQQLTHAHQAYFSRNSNKKMIKPNKVDQQVQQSSLLKVQLKKMNKMCNSKESSNSAETAQSNRLSNFYIGSQTNQEKIKQNQVSFHSRSCKDLSFKSKCFKFAQSKNIPNIDLIEVDSILVLENDPFFEGQKQNFILDESIVLRGLEETVFDRAVLSVGNV